MAGQGDVINIAFRGSYGAAGSTWSMVKDYRITSINTGGVLQTWLATIGTTYAALWVNDLLAVMDANFRLTQAEAFNRNNPSEQASYALSVAGTDAGIGLPLRVAAVIAKETGLRGRSFGGRFSFPALAAEVQDNGLITNAALALLTTFAAGARILGDATNQGVLTVYSPTLSTEDIVFNTLVNGFNVRNILGSIRSRQDV